MTTANYSLESNQITALYQTVLLRTPAAVEVTYWASALDSGTVTLSQVESAFVNSYEAQTIVDPIVRLYQAFFNRAPDASGLQYWEVKAYGGESITAIAQEMTQSVEFNNDYGTTGGAINSATAGSFVQTLYLNVLHRTATTSEIAYWVGQLGSTPTSASTAAVVNGFAQSNEFTANTATAINNWLTAAAAVSVAAATASSSGPAAGAGTYAQGSNVINPVVGTTTNLTTNIDTIVASSSYTTFNGSITATGTGSTLNSLDSITATGPGNVLNIADQTAGASTIPTISVSGVQTANITAVGAETVNTTTWTGLTALNILASTGNDVVTVASTTAVTVTDTLAAAATSGNTTIDGASGVTVTATGSSSGANVDIANILIGTVTPVSGAVVVNATETAGVAATQFGNITVKGGSTVTVNSVQNAGFAVSAALAGTITVSGETGAVVVNATTNISDTDVTNSHVITGQAVTVTGTSTVTVNEVIATTAAAAAVAAAAAGSVTAVDGAVTVLDAGTTTSVTINQTVATAKAAVTASAAGAAVVTAGGPGYSPVTTTAATAAVTAVPGVLAVTAGVVQIAGASVGAQTLGNASSSITTVALTNYATGSFINSTVLNSLTLAGTGIGGLTIDNLAANPVTTLALNLNGFTDTTGITDAGITTLNVATGGTKGSTLGAITDSALTTLNVSGSQVFTLSSALTAVNHASLAAINVSGSAGFTGDISGYLTASAPTFTTTSSGVITLTLDADSTHQQSFTGSTGQDIIQIASAATKTITAGTGTGNELILAGVAATFTTASMAKVTGFTTLGVYNAAADGTYDFNGALTGGFTAIDVISGTGTTATFANVAHNASLTLRAADTTANAFVYQSIDATGASDVVQVTLGTAATTGITIGNAADTGVSTATSSLLMEDTNGVGIGTLNIVSNGTAAAAAAHTPNTLVALADSGLTNLNVSGALGLSIGVFNEGITAGTSATAATGFTINNTSGGVVTVGTFTDSVLGSVTFSGTGNSAITTLAGVTGHALSITNSGSGTASIGTFNADTALTSLTLTGNVALNADATAGSPGIPAAAATQGGAAGLTISGATDNAHVNITVGGAGVGVTDTITLGNGNDYITDLSTTGNVVIKVGTGSNYIDVHSGTGTGSYAITLGTHTGVDSIFTAEFGTFAGTAIANTVITGAVTNDQIEFHDAGALTYAAVSAANQTTISGATETLAQAITLADTGLSAHTATSFVWGGNTYVIESAAAATGTVAAADSVVELVGTHTLSASATAGVFHLLS
ncbi:DUF4214 domain-containing protein [Telmatospirillum sp.]|uniref:DUF4214 domain-containing protein n=1 Tax=Telmatospirillum sp. TaxID=2079197 RepID=UPI003862DA04